jgi:S4 domain
MKRSKLGERIMEGLEDGLRWANGEIELPTTVVEKVTIAKLVQREGLAISISDSRRVVALGAVKLNGRVIEDLSEVVIVRTGDVLEVGKIRKPLLIGNCFPGTKAGRSE